jgi:hypothetical protein
MDWDIAHLIVDEVPRKLQESVQHAADECPVEAIIVIKKTDVLTACKWTRILRLDNPMLSNLSPSK